MSTSRLITERIEIFRSIMREEGLRAYIVPTADPHGSEYLSDHWKLREWLSGFTGSQGTLVITLDNVYLWVDSRYHLQADTETEGTGFLIQKEPFLDHLNIARWLADNIPSGALIGVDGELFTSSEIESFSDILAKKEVRLSTSINPFAQIWKERPSLPGDKPFVFDLLYSGFSAVDKLSLLRNQLVEMGVNAILVTALDDIAWLFNIRGSDIECNPVTMSYAYISDSEAILFIDPKKVTKDLEDYFASVNTLLYPYERVASYLSTIDPDKVLLVDKNKVNYKLFKSLKEADANLRYGASPVPLLKAVKNDTEIEGFRRAMIKDGVALTRFYKWVEEAAPQGGQTEFTIVEKLKAFKQEQENYIGESFNTICGYNANGAVVHYSVSEESAQPVLPEGFLLIDCGSQYLDGTTDITRTIALGELTDRQKTDYTLVLKGHIALASNLFPKGARGAQIDAFARMFLWNEGVNYLHGTGHGIGHFLNVHEGPQSIRMNENPVVLQPGMVLSNEPGLYRAGEYGIRIENLVLVVPRKETDFGLFYGFETLTLFPYDLNAIDRALLSPAEKCFINHYHQRVFAELSPYLTDEEQRWLQQKTLAI